MNGDCEGSFLAGKFAVVLSQKYRSHATLFRGEMLNFFFVFFCVEKERSLMKPVGEMSDVVFRLWQNSFLVQRQAGALTSLDAPEFLFVCSFYWKPNRQIA